MKRVSALLLALVTSPIMAARSHGQVRIANEQQREREVPIITVAQLHGERLDSLSLELGDHRLLVGFNGSLSITSASGRHTLRLPLPDNSIYEITRLQGFEVGRDVILIPEYQDGENAGACVVRLTLDPLRVRWVAPRFGFNVASPLPELPFLYVAAIGMVGKLDLNSGRYVWRHDDLYETKTGAFNSFQRPVRKGDAIVFESAPPGPTGRHITVEANTGKVLER